MKKVISIIIKNLFSEKILKEVFVKVGDYLVSSSKNKLDDKVWDVCKNKLMYCSILLIFHLKIFLSYYPRVYFYCYINFVSS